MSFVRLASAGLIALAIAFTSPPSPTSAQDDAGARLHFQAAARDFAAGRYETALTSFQAAYALSHRPQLLYNIALCHQELGHTAEAAENLRRFLAEVPNVPEREVLEARLARLDARAREEAAAAQAAQTTTTAVATTQTLPPEEPVEEEESAVPTSSWIAWSAGGATLLTGVILGSVGLARQNGFESGCGRTSSCDRGDVRRMERLGVFADVSFGLAIAATTTGVILYVKHRNNADADAPSAVVVPVLAPGTAGAVLAGSF
jgi:hypothetical protein